VFGVRAIEPLLYAEVAGVLALVVLLACLLPAWRASVMEPVSALRSE
jgi:ABC-type lipoprotein release transport system permease subunit